MLILILQKIENYYPVLNIVLLLYEQDLIRKSIIILREDMRNRN